MLKWRKKNSKGFSLVELIIVIAIMAILVGILAPQFIKYVEKSRISSDKQNIQEVVTAIQTYYADNSFKATTGNTIVFKTSGTTVGTDLKAALTAANIATPPALKSTKWGDDGETITVTAEGDGINITFSKALDSVS